MCGIAGIFNFDQRPISSELLTAMTSAIAHRGPDGHGEFIQPHIALGHTRLSILDLSEAGAQPMQSVDGRYVITYNGEIYNFPDLKKQLESLGHKFRSRSDTEVLLNAYIQWGEDFLTKLNGMFAFAIWDKQQQKLFLARDRYGIKPLYYYQHAHGVVFASEIKAIIASKIYQPQLDKPALVEYLTFQNFFTDSTLYKDIKTLMPGHFLSVGTNKKTQHLQYWDFCYSGDTQISEHDAIVEIDHLFNQAVQRQLISDVPVNAYLSGGLDSGAITIIASKFLPDLKNFTIGFDLSSASGLELAFDERTKAEYISYLAKTEHYEMVLKAGDMEKCMHKYIHHLEEPRVGQSYPNYYAAKLASKFGKVVLSGTGGDELFAGYPWRYFITDKNISFDSFIDQYYLKWQRLLPNDVLNNLLAPIIEEIKHVSTRDIFANVFKSIKKSHLSPEECMNYSLYLEAKTFLHGLLIVEDKLSMAHGLETRVPFLDNDLVDFALRVPINMKITHTHEQADENDVLSKIKSHRNGKYILRKTLSKYMDQKITDNIKQGFSSPDASWFRGESMEYVKKELTYPPEVFDKHIVQAIFKEHASGSKNNRLVIWSLLYLTKFLKPLLEKNSCKSLFSELPI